MEKFQLNWNSSQYEYGRYHVLNKSGNEVYQYKDLSDINLLTIKDTERRFTSDSDEYETNFILDNNIRIFFDGDIDLYLGPEGVIYYPVYDVQKAVDDEYSFYEIEDRIGFIESDEAISQD